MDSAVEEVVMCTTKLVRIGLPFLMCHLLAAGCLLTTNSDDDDSTVSDTGNNQDSTGLNSFSDSGTVDPDSTGSDESDDSVGESTGVPTGECSETRIVDGGFEAGTPSTAWMEASTQFGTPICDVGCTEDTGAEPYAGTWFAWFGGLAEPEESSVAQTVTLDGETAFLSFRFEINAAAGTGDDVFEVTLDGATTLFMVTDADVDNYDSYTPISIDISDLVDGAEHLVTFRSTFPGTGLTNFFLDEVALVTCVAGGGSSSSDSGSGTSAADSTGTSTDTGTDSGSSDSGSSSSDGSSSSST
jgi:hypothetical protein